MSVLPSIQIVIGNKSPFLNTIFCAKYSHFKKDDL